MWEVEQELFKWESVSEEIVTLSIPKRLREGEFILKYCSK